MSAYDFNHLPSLSSNNNNILDQIAQHQPFDWQDDEHLQRDLEFWDIPGNATPLPLLTGPVNRNTFLNTHRNPDNTASYEASFHSLNPVASRYNSSDKDRIILPSLTRSKVSTDTLSTGSSYATTQASLLQSSKSSLYYGRGTDGQPHDSSRPCSHSSTRPATAELPSPSLNVYNSQRSAGSSPTKFTGMSYPQSFLTNRELERVFSKDDVHRSVEYLPPITRSKSSFLTNWSEIDPVATVSPKSPPSDRSGSQYEANHNQSIYDDITFLRNQLNPNYASDGSRSSDEHAWIQYDKDKVWTVAEVDAIIRNQTNPIGKVSHSSHGSLLVMLLMTMPVVLP
jgi:hypothetical protein